LADDVGVKQHGRSKANRASLGCAHQWLIKRANRVHHELERRRAILVHIEGGKVEPRAEVVPCTREQDDRHLRTRVGVGKRVPQRQERLRVKGVPAGGAVHGDGENTVGIEIGEDQRIGHVG